MDLIWKNGRENPFYQPYHPSKFHTQIFALFRLPMRVTHDKRKEKRLFINASRKRRHKYGHEKAKKTASL
jgi:hypothetical protein